MSIEIAPFFGISYDVFRKGVNKVVKATSTDTRGAVEVHLVQDPKIVSMPHQARLWAFITFEERIRFMSLSLVPADAILAAIRGA